MIKDRFGKSPIIPALSVTVQVEVEIEEGCLLSSRPLICHARRATAFEALTPHKASFEEGVEWHQAGKADLLPRLHNNLGGSISQENDWAQAGDE